MCDITQDENELFELIKNTETYKKTFCASIDLLGVSSLIGKSSTNLNMRLYNLYSGFWSSHNLYPVYDSYNICFAGDSIFIVNDLTIDQEFNNDPKKLYEQFCGHIFGIASEINLLEHTSLENDNPCGVRVIISYGKTYDISKNNLWRDYPNWFVLTGPNTAVIKSLKAEKLGSKNGFKWNSFYYEMWDDEEKYKGVLLKPISPIHNLQPPVLYDKIYEVIDSQIQNYASLSIKWHKKFEIIVKRLLRKIKTQ